MEFLGRYLNHEAQTAELRRLLDLPSVERPEPRARMRRPKQHPSEETALRLVEGYRSGRSVRQLSVEFGLARDRIARMLKDVGVPVKHGLEIDLDLVDELHATGLTLEQIAQQLGSSTSALVRARRRGQSQHDRRT